MLDNIDKKNPFKVPDNYFENFHQEMMSKITQEPKAKVVPLWRRIAPWAAVAAILGGVIITTGIFNSESEPHVSINDVVINQAEKVYASSSEEDDFYLFLEDEVAKDSYYSAINF